MIEFKGYGLVPADHQPWLPFKSSHGGGHDLRSASCDSGATKKDGLESWETPGKWMKMGHEMTIKMSC